MAGKRVRAKRVIQDKARPTAQRMHHADGAVECGWNGQITMRDAPLERALVRGAINEPQYEAGKKYRHHWYHAGLAGSIGSSDLNRVFGGDNCGFGMAKTEAEAFHRQRYRQARDKIGPHGETFLELIVCQEVTLERAGYALGWGNKVQAIAAATQQLRGTLDALRALWGIGC